MSIAAEVPQLDEQKLMDWLEPLQDPELHLSMVGLGLIYSCQYSLEDKKVVTEMTLTSPACPMGDYLVRSVRDRLLEHEAVDEAEVKIVWEPKWDPQEMATEEVKEELGIW